MKNYVQIGDTLVLTAPADGAKAGSPIIVEDLFAIPITDATPGDDVACSVVGVFTLPKVPGAITQGKKVYWQALETVGVTATQEGNRLIGVATEAAQAGQPEIKVRLNGAVS